MSERLGIFCFLVWELVQSKAICWILYVRSLVCMTVEDYNVVPVDQNLII